MDDAERLDTDLFDYARERARGVAHLWGPPKDATAWLESGDPSLRVAAQRAARRAKDAAHRERKDAVRDAALSAMESCDGDPKVAARQAGWFASRALGAANIHSGFSDWPSTWEAEWAEGHDASVAEWAAREMELLGPDAGKV